MYPQISVDIIHVFFFQPKKSAAAWIDLIRNKHFWPVGHPAASHIDVEPNESNEVNRWVKDCCSPQPKGFLRNMLFFKFLQHICRSENDRKIWLKPPPGFLLVLNDWVAL